MRIKISILVIVSLFLSCNSSKSKLEGVQIQQINSDYPVIVRVDMTNNKIFRIEFPFEFEFTNLSKIKRRISAVDYFYNKNNQRNTDGSWNSSIWVYQINNENLIDRGVGGSSSDIPSICDPNSQRILVYPSHLIDTTQTTQEILRSYLKQIKARGITQEKDTLSIGTFNEFKKMHPELTKILLEGDSISFNISNNENQMDTLIVLPIRY
ncbi:hypothetical protein [Dysgonomonas sp. ZJ279]|uniref:hypothetical protein n=1 Tax=Dysgonomonas sp. ZJ279 TaxID=2709796 RepID=UPI0013EE33BB|nr:hypothetical protein [Dysgonomonas sp. ZJ279]